MKWTGANVLAFVLLGGAVLCAVLSMVGIVIGHEPWLSLLAVTSEQNFPTWYSVVLILIAAAIALTAGLLNHSRDPRLARRWYFLSALLVLLSLDEAASLHERLESVGSAIVSGGGLLHFTWVVPGIILAGLVMTTVYTLGRELPRPVAVELLAGFGVFLFAAVGLEMVGGLVLSTIGEGWTYVIVSTIEEFLENVGMILVTHAVARTVAVHHRPNGGYLLRYGLH